MAELGEITAKLTADVGSFTSGMANAKTSLENFQTSAATATSGTKTFYEGVSQAGEFAMGSERGVRRMEFALGSMAAQAVGASHGLGTLIEGLLLFSGGSAVTIGVLAGITAIVGVISLLEAGSNASKKALEELEKELDKIGPHAKMVADQMRLDELKRRLEELQSDVRGDLSPANIMEQWRILMGGTPLPAQIAAQQMKVNADAGEFRDKVEQANEKLQERLDAFIDQIALQQDTLKFQEAFTDAVQKSNEAIRQLHADILEGPIAGGEVRAEQFGAKMFGSKDMTELDKQISETVDRSNKAMDKVLAEQERSAKQWGDRISTALVDGMTGKLQALGDLMKSIIEQWLSKNVITPFLVTLGIASPSTFGMYVGQMVGEGVGIGMQTAKLGPMGMNLNVNVAGGGAASDPFSLARDATWQRALRESLLVAQQQGFSTPVAR